MPPEVSISLIHPEEPPSPRGLLEHIRLTSRRNLQLVSVRLHRTFRRVPLNAKTAFLASCTALVAAGAYGSISLLHTPKAHALATDDRERVEVAISSYFDPFTIAPQPRGEVFANVSVSGDGGAGGPDSQLQAQSYTVQQGDTLSAIANSYGFSSGTLMLANKQLQGSDVIHPGEVLTIPAQAAGADQLAAIKKSTSVTKASVASGASRDPSYIVPVKYSYESQGFSSTHPGRDMVAPYASPIRATKSGCIISQGGGWNGGYGNLVIEDLGGGITARYAHLSSFQKGVTAGVCVSQGDVIGYLGSTGNSTGPHLHFELRRNGIAFDPQL